MPYYHATWLHQMDSIRSHGLNASRSDQRNFDDSELGVYLALDPFVALSILIEAYAFEGKHKDVAPKDVLELMKVIVVDDSRVDRKLLQSDPNINRDEIALIYRGVIDITGLLVLDVSDIIPDNAVASPQF